MLVGSPCCNAEQQGGLPDLSPSRIASNRVVEGLIEYQLGLV